MKTTAILTLTSMVLGLTSFTLMKQTDTYKISTDASKIEWFAEKVTGKHNGLISLKSGSLEMKEGKLSGGRFEVDMQSIIVSDLEGEYKQKLENHLKSDDFFGVKSHPVASFVITSAEEQNEGQFNTIVTGSLTIKGITHPISFPASIKASGDKVAAYGEMVIDRSKFNVRYGSNSFFDDLGDKAIYDEFTLKISLGGNK